MKRTTNYGWGQSTINTVKKLTDRAIRKTIIQGHKRGENLADVLTSMWTRNQARAEELYSNCDVLNEALKQ